MNNTNLLAPRATQRAAEIPWLTGARAALPFAMAFMPYALAIGAVAERSDVGGLLGWSTSWLVYAGTSQLVGIQLVDAGASAALVIGIVVLINARMVAYAAALSPAWRTAPPWWTAMASYVLVDPAYLISTEHGPARATDEPEVHRRQRQHYLGAAVTLWLTWLVNCAVGVIVGGRLSAYLPGGLVGELMLASIVAMSMSSSASRLAASLGFALGVPAALLPFSLGAPLACLTAIAVTASLTGRRA